MANSVVWKLALVSQVGFFWENLLLFMFLMMDNIVE